MSVPSRKRRQSKFQVLIHFLYIRKEITNFLLYDFGFSKKKSEAYLLRSMGDKTEDEMSAEELRHYKLKQARHEAFSEWFIADMRVSVMRYLRDIQENISLANSMYPEYYEELIERRMYQDRAIGLCNGLKQELNYIIDTLPVDINRYTRFALLIDDEINLLKGWRKSGNKFRKRLGVVSESASNFANVNSNGNANNNNASNSNEVRPDFEDA